MLVQYTCELYGIEPIPIADGLLLLAVPPPTEVPFLVKANKVAAVFVLFPPYKLT